MIDYWEQLSTYHAHIESGMGINVKSLGPLMHLIRSPTLIVGAGQGLLVEALRRQGIVADGVDLSAQMIAQAERRRGIKLIHASADAMPFPDKRFATSIVATGVVDFMDDEARIRSIVEETMRVTDGEVLVAFYSFSRPVEDLMRYIGVISESDRYSVRRSLSWLFARDERLDVIRSSPQKSMAGVGLRAVRAAWDDPQHFLQQRWHAYKLAKRIKRGELSAPDAILDASTSIDAPYRNAQGVRKLLDRLGRSPRTIYEQRNCIVVRL